MSEKCLRCGANTEDVGGYTITENSGDFVKGDVLCLHCYMSHSQNALKHNKKIWRKEFAWSIVFGIGVLMSIYLLFTLIAGRFDSSELIIACILCGVMVIFHNNDYMDDGFESKKIKGWPAKIATAIFSPITVFPLFISKIKGMKYLSNLNKSVNKSIEECKQAMRGDYNTNTKINTDLNIESIDHSHNNLETNFSNTSDKGAIDIIFNSDSDENVVLYDSDDKPTEFKQIAVIPLNHKMYCILAPVIPYEGMADDEAIAFELNTSGEDLSLDVVKDDSISDQLFEEYHNMLLERIKQTPKNE